MRKWQNRLIARQAAEDRLVYYQFMTRTRRLKRVFGVWKVKLKHVPEDEGRQKEIWGQDQKGHLDEMAACSVVTLRWLGHIGTSRQ